MIVTFKPMENLPLCSVFIEGKELVLTCSDLVEWVIIEGDESACIGADVGIVWPLVVKVVEWPEKRFVIIHLSPHLQTDLVIHAT